MELDIDGPSRQLVSLFNAIVAPRPIGWISSISAAGAVNLAPFSYFNGICPAPAMVMFTCNGPEDRHEKDTLANVREVPEFVANYASWELRKQVVLTSATLPRGGNEMAFAGLAPDASRRVRPPRVAEAIAHLECKVVRIVELPAGAPGEVSSCVVIGRVVALHADDRFLTPEGRFDFARAGPLTRLGGLSYGGLGAIEDIDRPHPPTRAS